MKAEFAFVGLNDYGEIRAISLDDPGAERENAKLVAEWLKMGRRVERIPFEEVRKRITPSNGKRSANND